MSTVELRQRLIDKISQTKDNRILEEAYRLLEQDNEETEVYLLREDQKAAIEEARNQIKTGRGHTEEQANKEMDQWLNR